MTADPTTIAALSSMPGDAPPRDENEPPRTFARQALIDTFASTGARIGSVWISLLVLGAVFAPFVASSFPILLKQGGRWSSPLINNLQPTDWLLLTTFFVSLILLLTRRLTFWQSVLCILWWIGLLLPLTLWPAVRDDHWLPAPEIWSRRTGVGLLVIFAAIDLAMLILISLRATAPRRAKIAVGVLALPVIFGFFAFKVRPPQNVIYETYREARAAGEVQFALNAPVPYSPSDYERDQPEARLQPPSREHWLGTEQSGADVFSRMLHATRIALSIGFISTGIAVIIGVTIGGLMGYFAGIVDMLGMRLIEIFEAVPVLVLLLTVCAFFGHNLYLMMTILGLFGWTGNARFIRAEFLRLRKQDFVQAAIAGGLPLRSIIFRHMLPNGITPVLVNTSFGVASAILLESTLSFLGLGLVDEPSWGQLLEQARAGGTGFQWWIAAFPGLAIFLTVFAYNLIGEAMRDALDPRLKKRE